MSDVLAILEDSREMLHRAAYDTLPIARPFEGLVRTPKEQAEERDYLRRRFAMGPWCSETTEPLQHAVKLVVPGIVRRERHSTNRDMHYFISVSPHGGEGAIEDDVVVDPTYLQYADLDHRSELEELPIMFIGLRRAIIEKMRTPLFGAKEEIAQLYMAQTLSEI